MEKFDLEIDQSTEQIQINLYDDEGEWYAQCIGDEFVDVLRHALHMANPVLAAQCWPDYFDWCDKHRGIGI